MLPRNFLNDNEPPFKLKTFQLYFTIDSKVLNNNYTMRSHYIYITYSKTTKNLNDFNITHY